MKHLIIIGARGLGREIFSAAKKAVGFGTEFDIKGFLDSKTDALVGMSDYAPILASPEDYLPVTDDVFITAMGDVKWHRYYAEMMERKGAQFTSIIHNTVYLEQNAVIGKDCYIAHNVVVSVDVRIGDHVMVLHNAVIGHDNVLEDYAHIFAFVFIGGGCHIGSGAAICPGARIVPHRKIGKNAVVGVGGVVILNVTENTTVVGNPAKKIWA